MLNEEIANLLKKKIKDSVEHIDELGSGLVIPEKSMLEMRSSFLIRSVPCISEL